MVLAVVNGGAGSSGGVGVDGIRGYHPTWTIPFLGERLAELCL